MARISFGGILDTKPIEGVFRMENLAVAPHVHSSEQGPRVQLLVADDDARLRALLTVCARDRVGAIVVLEARDGAEAVQLGLQHKPEIALLDVNMPKRDGIEVAVTLLTLQPQMCLALQTADPHAHRDRARAHGLPLFDKLELDRALSWIEEQVRASVHGWRRLEAASQRDVECSSSGYRITA